jgi:O-methyltransferase involved in polyketide biosynthesis
MRDAQSSRTARRVALGARPHQRLDEPRVFDDPLAVAIADGAGLDTFAYRNPLQSPVLHVFEVDHPATQQ